MPKYQCMSCKAIMESQPILCQCGRMKSYVKVKGKSGRTDSQKRSREQEKVAAATYGGRKVPGSGSMDHSKGDVRKRGIFLMECKCTTAKSYRLTMDTLGKVSNEAHLGEIPVMEIEFQSVSPSVKAYVIPQWAWEEYLELKTSR